MTIKTHSYLSAAALSLLVNPCLAGPQDSFGKNAPVDSAPIAETSPSKGGLGDFLKTGGTLYSNSDNPLIQEFKIFGRLQYQLGILDGDDSLNDSVSYDTDEFRRTRFGASMKFLKYFKVSAEIEDLIRDNEPRGGTRELDVSQLWHGHLTFDMRNALGLDNFDGLKIGYGRREVNVSEEWNVSSKRIRTVERSAIANKIWPSDEAFSNPTGLWVEGENSAVAWELGVFSTTTADWIAGWQDGQLYYANAQIDFSDRTGMDLSEWVLAGIYQDVNLDDDRLAGGIEWAASAGLRLGQGRWELAVNGIVGDNGDQSNSDREGSFWGFVLSPSYWLIEDRLEAVAQYQYQGSEADQGIRVNSRYIRRAQSTGDAFLINSGRGDEHHSFYAGLSYYIYGHNLKLMGGVQYDDISSDGTHVYDGWTGFLGLRLYF